MKRIIKLRQHLLELLSTTKWTSIRDLASITGSSPITAGQLLKVWVRSGFVERKTVNAYQGFGIWTKVPLYRKKAKAQPNIPT